MPPKSLLKRLSTSEMQIKREMSPQGDTEGERPSKRLRVASDEPLDLSTTYIVKKEEEALSPSSGRIFNPQSPGASALKKRLLRDYLSDTGSSPAVSPVPIPTPREVSLPPNWKQSDGLQPYSPSSCHENQMVSKTYSMTPSPVPAAYMSPYREESLSSVKSPYQSFPSPVSFISTTQEKQSTVLTPPPAKPAGTYKVQDKIHMSGGAITSPSPQYQLPMDSVAPHLHHGARLRGGMSHPSPASPNPSPYRYECEWVQYEQYGCYPGFPETSFSPVPYDSRYFMPQPNPCIRDNLGGPSELLQRPSPRCTKREHQSLQEMSAVPGKETFKDRFLSHLMRKSKPSCEVLQPVKVSMPAGHYPASPPCAPVHHPSEGMPRSGSYTAPHTQSAGQSVVSSPPKRDPKPITVNGFKLPVPVTDAQLFRTETTEKVQVSFRGLSGGSVKTFPVAPQLKTAVVKPYKLNH